MMVNKRDLITKLGVVHHASCSASRLVIPEEHIQSILDQRRFWLPHRTIEAHCKELALLPIFERRGQSESEAMRSERCK